jgi:UDP-N-acetylmuramoyl-L-alanyl-D-glutamate--2,6-diaminopimelate ligase
MGHPGAEVDVVAVTGTNGKTTTVNLIRHLLAGRPGGAAALGTLGVTGPDGEVWPGTEGLTTPDPVKLARWMRQLADAGVAVVAMEASSHALDQCRMDAIPVRVAVFTNFTRDHLDYHGSLEAYREAKLRLAGLVTPDGAVAVNATQPAWNEVQAGRRMTYAVQAPADVRAENVILRSSGTHFTLHHGQEDVPVALPLLGSFNAENAVAAAAVGLLLGMTLGEVAERLESAPQIPGRMERVVSSPFTVIIDFAHTPDALETLLSTVKAVARGRLLVLFGAGGDRDRGKRRPMAEAVSRYADRVYLTSDNPRTEDPERILDDLAPGLASVDTVREVDRRAAIRAAVLDAEEGDVLVLAGKGHERYQVVGSSRFELDERAEVQAAMALRGAA